MRKPSTQCVHSAQALPASVIKQLGQVHHTPDLIAIYKVMSDKFMKSEDTTSDEPKLTKPKRPNPFIHLRGDGDGSSSEIDEEHAQQTDVDKATASSADLDQPEEVTVVAKST